MLSHPNPVEPLNFLRVIHILVFAMIAGQILFMGIAFYLVRLNVFTTDQSLAPVLLLALSAAAGIAALTGNIVYTRIISTARIQMNLHDKLAAFRNAIILRYATLEAGGLMSIFGFLITGHILFILLFFAIILVEILLFPTANNVSATLKLPVDERHLLLKDRPWK